MGAERGLRAHNVLAAREFRAGQKFFEVIEARDLALEITQCRSRGQASEYMIISFIRYSVRVCMGVKSHSVEDGFGFKAGGERVGGSV